MIGKENKLNEMNKIEKKSIEKIKENNIQILNKKTKRTNDKDKNNSLDNKRNPKNFHYLRDLAKDSYIYNDFLDNIFTVFKSIDDIFYLIYVTKRNSIIAYNLISNQKITEIIVENIDYKNFILNVRHYTDKINKKDLLITVISDNNSI